MNEYDPFTPPDLTLKGESSNEEIEEDIIKENEPEFIEERSIDHNITFDHIYEKDLEEIANDIDQAEELHAIYAEDIMIPSGEKEAVEHYYMEQMKAEGVIITNDLYFEETAEKKQATHDHFNEPTTTSINSEKEQLNKELDPTTKANFTEIDGKEISLTNDIEYNNEAHESMEISKEINEHHEEIQIQEEKNLDANKSEVKDIDKEQEIPQKYSSGQHATQILQEDVEENKNQESQETKEEKLNDTKEIQQNLVKENLTSEVKNEIDKKKMPQKLEKNQINSSDEKGISEIISEKKGFDHKIKEQETEIKENKPEGINKEIELKEEWEKELVNWIRGVKDKDLPLEKKGELIEFMRKYCNAREEHKRLHYLNVQHKKKEISKEEKQERIYLREKIKEYDELDEEMFKEFHAFRCFYDYNKKGWYDTITNLKKKRYPKLVGQKLQRLKEIKIKKSQDYQEQDLGELSKELSDEHYELLMKRYHQETGRRAIYGKKETKGFKRWKEVLNETLENLDEEFSESSYEVNGDWSDALKSHIPDVSDEVIPQEFKEEMKYVIDNFSNLQKSSINLPPNYKQIIEELRQFQANYDEYKERGYDKSIPREVGRVAKKLKKKLEEIKKEAILGIILNGSKIELQNFTEILSENLYKSKMSLDEKSKINKIIQKKKLVQKDKEELLSLLNNLSGKDLNLLLRDNFKNLIDNRLESELSSNKQSQSIYTALDLIDDLMAEIQKYSEELAIIWPERVQKYTYSMLASVWGYHSGYVRQHCYYYKIDSEHRIADKALLKLNKRLITHYNEKAFGCLKIIDNYKNSKINLNDFFTLICNELGRISGKVVLTQEEASLILGFDVESRLTDIRHRHKNYKFSMERLEIMLENIDFIFAEKGKKCFELIQKYKDLNKDLKEYPGQQHNVGKPHYFRNILPGEFQKAYLLGFLGHDACLINANTRISLTINPKDRIIINKLANAIELDMSEIKITPETRFLVYRGKLKIYHTLRLRYGCRSMYEDLKNRGFITIKDKLKKIPDQIKDLIELAKLEDFENWYETTAGLTALAWLLGFYDADGSYLGFNYGVLYSHSNKYLNEIKRLFEIKAKIDTLVEPGTVAEIFGRQYISKGMFGLRISSQDVFIKMMQSYEDSLQRKRPKI